MGLDTLPGRSDRARLLAPNLDRGLQSALANRDPPPLLGEDRPCNQQNGEGKTRGGIEGGVIAFVFSALRPI